MLIASISIGFAPSSKVCDFRLALESDAQKNYAANRSVYSTNRSFYESLGVKTTSAVCVNAQNVGPGKPKDACHKHCNTSCCVGSIYEYIDQSDTTIQKCWDESNLANELTPDGIVILDLEHPPEAHPRHWWAASDALLRGIVNATRRRFNIVRQSLPHAKLGLYGTYVHDSPFGFYQDAAWEQTKLSGYQRASQMGVFDDIDILVPVLYLGPHMFDDAYNTTLERLNVSSQIKRSNGSAMPMWPNLRYATFPLSINVPMYTMNDQLRAIEDWWPVHGGGAGQTPIGGVLYWNGKDNETMARWFADNDPVRAAGCR